MKRSTFIIGVLVLILSLFNVGSSTSEPPSPPPDSSDTLPPPPTEVGDEGFGVRCC